MIREVLFLVFTFSVTTVLTQQELDWWQTTTIYQIYPRSYKDSDGNGVGDLRGILERVEHVKESGAGAIWLSPIYLSPMKDFGYDIANQTFIDPLFGTLEDLLTLRDSMTKLGEFVSCSFVHTALQLVHDILMITLDQHEWFQKSVKRIDPYTDYYIWHDGKVDNVTGERSAPNNWYYYHVFTVEQPDLNYRSQYLVDDMKDVMRYWLNLGVDGFRVDSIPHLFEDTRFLDEPWTNKTGTQEGDYDSVEHIYTQNLPETYDMVCQFRAVVDEYKARVMMTEAYADTEQMMAYYGTDDKPGAHFTFNFMPIMYLSNSSTAQDFSDVIHDWVDNVPEGRWGNWVFGNHDQHRVASRYGLDLADAINMLVTLLPGTAISYMGEEIAMEDTPLTWEQTVDPQGLNAGQEHYVEFSRDPERTPYQWDNTTSAGRKGGGSQYLYFVARTIAANSNYQNLTRRFSTNATTWLPVNPNYLELNLEAEIIAETSHFKVYQQLTGLRNTKTIQLGSLNTQVVSEWIFTFSRELGGEDTYIVLVNLGEEDSTVDLTKFYSDLPETVIVAVASVNSGHARGHEHSPQSLVLKGKQSLVITTGELL
uniref:alpha-glucosidase n=1 Tax=Timema tahoe TaxID=61484 RepID=A0A7R9NXI1_9NEOP|nr:unnamed protein product [Timema tahoe]